MESYAIDLSWDILCRFGILTYVPDEFLVDWFEVAIDECRHFRMLNKRMKELGEYHYGSFPAHGGLWIAANATEHDIMLRLCILHMVHEARGLDMTPNNIRRLKEAKDFDSANVLTVILEEEISHVQKGVKWFKFCSARKINESRIENGLEPIQVGEKTIIEMFHKMVRENPCGSGYLKPPFNHQAREQAGFTKEWYEPLIITSSNPSSKDQEEVQH